MSAGAGKSAVCRADGSGRGEYPRWRGRHWRRGLGGRGGRLCSGWLSDIDIDIGDSFGLCFWFWFCLVYLFPLFLFLSFFPARSSADTSKTGGMRGENVTQEKKSACDRCYRFRARPRGLGPIVIPCSSIRWITWYSVESVRLTCGLVHSDFGFNF